MHSYLTTKAASLSLEAKYIRQQELKFSKAARNARDLGKDRSAAWHEKNREGQYLHRISVVRDEARATNLARGFLRGKEYGEVEQHSYSEPNWFKVQRLVLDYVERDNPRWNQSVENTFSDWLNRAKNYFFTNKLFYDCITDEEVNNRIKEVIDTLTPVV